MCIFGNRNPSCECNIGDDTGSSVTCCVSGAPNTPESTHKTRAIREVVSSPWKQRFNSMISFFSLGILACQIIIYHLSIKSDDAC